MALHKVFNIIKDQKPVFDPISLKQMEENIEKIQAICNTHYTEQSVFGNAALNRLILLDSRVADLLTPDVIQYLFTQSGTHTFPIKRKNTTISLADSIYYGFADGLHVIRLMPNNEETYNLEKYHLQKEKFEDNTLRILQNIYKAAKISEEKDSLSDIFNTDFKWNNLSKKFQRVSDIITYLVRTNKSSDLISVPGFTEDEIKGEVISGFNMLLKKLRNKRKGKITLDGFCEAFLTTPDVVLDGGVSHFFYDRAHFQAALAQQTLITIEGEKYSFTDILKKMIDKISSSASFSYPLSTVEQFRVRLYLVDRDLHIRFPEIYFQDFSKIPTDELLTQSDLESKQAEKDEEESSDEELEENGLLMLKLFGVFEEEFKSKGCLNTIEEGLHRLAIDKLNAFDKDFPCGPNIKNYATLELEAMLAKLYVSTYGIPHLINRTNHHISGTIYYINNKIYDMQKLLQSVNFDEVVLDEKVINFLVKICLKNYKNCHEKIKVNLDLDLYPDQKNKAIDFYQDPLTFVGAQVIKKYNDDSSIFQNCLEKPSNPDVKEVIIKIFEIIAASKLLYKPAKRPLTEEKIPASVKHKENQVCFRIETVKSSKMQEVLKHRIEMMENKQPITVQRFISTAATLDGLLAFMNNTDITVKVLDDYLSIVTIFLDSINNPTARFLNPELLYIRREREKLIPPGVQIVNYAYQQHSNCHIFFAKSINTIRAEVYTKELEQKIERTIQEKYKNASAKNVCRAGARGA